MTGHWTEFIVFLVLFLGVAVMGFMASRWKAGDTMEHLDEWGLGGRKFGGWITWFLVGGDLYTAYTFVAVPALVFGAGALGFYALPYTVVLYPIVFLPVLRLWSVSRAKGYVTPADFVRGRYGSPTLALIVAITGIVATMPYIALQLVGLESVLRTMGINGHGIIGHLPLFLAFVVLALYTFQSGLRAAGADRLRQGRFDLPRHHRRGHLPAVETGRLGLDLRQGAGQVRRDTVGDRRHPAGRQQPAAVRTPWRWVRRWPCSSTRTRRPASWPPAAAT